MEIGNIKIKHDLLVIRTKKNLQKFGRLKSKENLTGFVSLLKLIFIKHL